MAFYRRWVVACAAGGLVGIGTAAFAAVGVTAWLGEPATWTGRLLLLLLFAAVGVVEGGALGWLQWRVLRSRLPGLRAGEWVGITVTVAVLGWLVGMLPSTLAGGTGVVGETPVAPAAEPGLGLVLLLAALAGAAAGLCFGAAQWLVLRRHARRAERWIWVHVPAWALAMAAIFLGAALPTTAWPGWLVGVSGTMGGVVGGLLLGAVTGLVARDLTPWVSEV
jgi:hypothetical protein